MNATRQAQSDLASITLIIKWLWDLLRVSASSVDSRTISAASVVSLTLLYISRMLKKVLRVTLNEVKGLMYLKRRDSSLRSE